MKRPRLAIVGYGALGRACALGLIEAGDLELAGVVRRTAGALPAPLHRVAVAAHLRDLKQVDAALLCVPPDAALGVAREILQQRIPLVECARLEGHALQGYHDALDRAARNHRVAVITGAGWDPGVLPLIRRLFEALIPRGQTLSEKHPGLSLHHTAIAAAAGGVKDALATEHRTPGGGLQRYVYVELEQGADIGSVTRAIEADPLFVDARVHVFAVPDLAALEAAGSGIVLERRATATAGRHESLLLEARFDAPTFAARVMLDAARGLAELAPGAHRHALR
ncbi:MAG: NAD(P)-binding domain-containing protein [Burkholderiales bacterium]